MDKRKGTPYFSKLVSEDLVKSLGIDKLKYVTLVKPPLPDVYVRYENKGPFLERIEKIERINEDMLELKSTIRKLYDVRIIYVNSRDVYLYSPNVRESLEEIGRSVCTTIKVREFFSHTQQQRELGYMWNYIV